MTVRTRTRTPARRRTLAVSLRRIVAACRAEGKRRPPRDVMSRAAERIRTLLTPERRR